MAVASHEIATERLVLSALRDDDAPALLRYRSDPRVSRYQSWEPTGLADAVKFIESVRDVRFGTPGEWFQFGMRLRDGRALVGDIGVHVPADEPRQAEVGISLDPAVQGRGLATEALTALFAHLFDACGTHRVFASVDPRNEASVALMRRMGMRQEAHLRESLWFKGEWADDLVFAMLSSDRGRG